MDRRSVFRLAAVSLAGTLVAGCEAPRNDGAMFQRWARTVTEIPLDEREAGAAAADRPGAPRAVLPQLTLSAEAAGLRAPMKVAVVDPLDMPNARDVGLRAAMAVGELLPGDPGPARMERAAYARPPAAAGAYSAQLASFRSRGDAERAWAALKARHGALFGGLSPAFEPVDLGARGEWVRLKATGLASPQAAAALCAAAGVVDSWCVKGGASS